VGDVAAVTEQLAEETPHQARHRAAIIDIARREAKGQEFAAIIDEQMQLEAVEPADRGFAAAGVDGEDLVLTDARVLTDGERCRVDEADAGARPELGIQIDGQRHQDAGHELDEATVAHELQKLTAQVPLDVFGVERLAGAGVRLLEEDQDRHELTGVQPPLPQPTTASSSKQLLAPTRRELLPDIVHRAEEGKYPHDQHLLELGSVDVL
jgi:hypothetical protein